MDQQELKSILDLHRKWVIGETGGKRADLSSADLRSANLRYADLRSANLSSADLRYADLRSADLSSANLSSADLRYANLSSANLSYADLSSADLRSANLSSADLRSANLSSADLSSADLSEIKKDFLDRLALAKNEAIGLYDAIIRGRINGSAYEGECACFCGTIANLRKENYESLSCGLKPDANSLTERWFLALAPGLTPDWHPVAKITSEWIEEFISTNGLILPKYKLFSSLEKPELFLDQAVKTQGG